MIKLLRSWIGFIPNVYNAFTVWSLNLERVNVCKWTQQTSFRNKISQAHESSKAHGGKWKDSRVKFLWLAKIVLSKLNGYTIEMMPSLTCILIVQLR